MNPKRKPPPVPPSATNAIPQAALAYHARGWSLIPMRMADKLPARRWKDYQTKRATEAQLRGWFGGPVEYGLAVIFGAISGGLASRDFDDLKAYERWASEHPDLAATLPTVETQRGRHVYFQSAPDRVNALRARLGKPDGVGAIAFTDGELRCGVGCYSVLPPSRHPSGHVYSWIIALPPGPLPVLDPFEAGFVATPRNETERTEEGREDRADRGQQSKQKQTEQTEAITKVGIVLKLGEPATWPEAVQRLMLETLPAKGGQRNRAIFALARALKGIPAFADADARDLEPFVRHWHKLASPYIHTKPYEETLIDFLHAWPRVKFPAGSEPMAKLLAQAKAAAPPTIALRYEQAELRLLVSLCRELQQAAAPGPFFLSCRTAGRLLGVPHGRAWRWLFLLEQQAVIVSTEKGGPDTNRATRYRYVVPA